LIEKVKLIQYKNLRLNGHTSFEFQTKIYITCFGYICNHPHGQENHTQKSEVGSTATVPQYFFSTGTAGTFQKSTGTAVLLFFIFRRYSVLFNYESMWEPQCI